MARMLADLGENQYSKRSVIMMDSQTFVWTSQNDSPLSLAAGHRGLNELASGHISSCWYQKLIRVYQDHLNSKTKVELSNDCKVKYDRVILCILITSL